MLDLQRYRKEFPDEESEPLPRLLSSEELLVTLAAIEKEISAFIRAIADEALDESQTARTDTAD